MSNLATIAALLEGMHDELQALAADMERTDLERIRAKARDLSKKYQCGYAIWRGHDGYFLTHIKVVPGGPAANRIETINYEGE